MPKKKYRTYSEGDLLITELQRGKRYSIRVRFPPDRRHGRWWYSKSRKVEAGSKAEAVKLGLEYKAELTQASITKIDVDITVGEYARQWHTSRKEQGKVQPLTIARDETEIRRIEEYLGDVRLREVNADVIDRAYTRMAEDGISQSGRSKVHGKLKQVLKQALASGVIDRNPCEGIQGMGRPKVAPQKRDEQRVDEDDLVKLFEILGSLPQDGKTVALWLGAATGMRRGEVLALSWREVDLAGGTIAVRWQLGKEKVRKAPKTEGSARTVRICDPADVSSDPTIAYLRAWRRRQRELFEKYNERLEESKRSI